MDAHFWNNEFRCLGSFLDKSLYPRFDFELIFAGKGSAISCNLRFYLKQIFQPKLMALLLKACVWYQKYENEKPLFIRMFSIYSHSYKKACIPWYNFLRRRRLVGSILRPIIEFEVTYKTSYAWLLRKWSIKWSICFLYIWKSRKPRKKVA